MLPKGLLKEYSKTLSLLVRCMDMVTVFVAGWIAYFLRFTSLALPSDHFIALWVAALATPIVFSFAAIYQSVRGERFFLSCHEINRSDWHDGDLVSRSCCVY